MVVSMAGEVTSTIELAPSELGEALSSMRLCAPRVQQQMKLSLSRLGQLTAVQAYRVGSSLELFDGLKRLRAARELSWPTLRVEIHGLDATGAKVGLLRCNASTGLSELEEAWLVRSLYREDHLSQAHIAVLLARHKSWICRRLALAEGLSDELTASVRLGLISATAAVALGRLQRCNQDRVARVVSRRGLTTRQTARLVDTLLAAPPEQWPELLEQPSLPPVATGSAARRTPGEQLMADAWAMRRLAARLQVRLLERSLTSLGESACAVVAVELTELRSTIGALAQTLETRLRETGASDGPA
jgi:ParB-like chromosome segregation protein Spo0J